jgi:tol-pal system protein YbgF
MEDILRVCIIYALLLLSGGCFSNKQGKALKGQVEQLQKQVKELDSSSTADRDRLTKAVATAESEVADLEELLKKVDRFTKGDFAKLAADQDSQKRLVDQLRINVEEIVQKLEAVGDAQKNISAEITKITGKLEKPVAVQPSMPTEPSALFAYGETKLKESSYTEARKAFREYIKSNASGPKAEDSQYNLGESYYNEAKYDDATREYSKVLETYPNGDRADDALYRLSVAAMQLGQCDFAEVYLNELTSKYKKSPFFKDAQKQLKDIPTVRKAGKCK